MTMQQHRNRTTARARQRGLTFIGVVLIGVLAVAAFAVGGRSVPIFIEYYAIKKAAIKAAREGSTVPEIRASFDRAASIDDITSISGKDLDIGKENDKIVVAYSYSREIHLAGPAYLVYRFEDAAR
ncbi:protein of unknown function [Oryzisolibacter propanilivorax]|uniref:DUF4845 domain-containing protein n=1 Tax=Oryzisolibacter propanilivorax TaxID=1527607 RepID=A0A1G9R506_9BURK|nr:protein of unknown function [Oryzisolibacter propanilivorax]